MKPRAQDIARRGFLGGAIGLAAGIALDRYTSQPDEPQETTPPQDPEQIKHGEGLFEQRVEDAITPKRKRRYEYAIVHTASAPADVGDSRSRLDYVKEMVNQANFPPLLKSLLPYLPFQESDYIPNRKGKIALGAWQFIRGTGKKYGLIKNGKDYRTDFKKSTEAALRYFEDIYNRLSNDPNYNILKKRYNLGDDFISLATLNAFNAGEGHMLRAFEVMATEPSVREVVDNYGAKGDKGLFYYMSQIYILDYKKWQQGPPYYHLESGAYDYDIAAFKMLHEGGEDGKPAPEVVAETGPDEVRYGVGTAVASVAGIGTALIAATALDTRILQNQGRINKIGEMTRVDLYAVAKSGTTIFVAGGAGVLAMGPKLRSYDEAPDAQELKLLEPLAKNDVMDMRDDLFVVYEFCQSNKASKPLQKNSRDLQAVDNDRGLVHNPLYGVNLCLADGAYEMHKQTGDEKYLKLAHYYYKRCLYLVEGQIKGQFKKPKGGMAVVMRRRKYLQGAMKVVSGSFRRGE